MSTRTLVRAARWTTVLAAAAVLAAAGVGTAVADGPVSGTEGAVEVGADFASPSISPDGATAYVSVVEADRTVTVKAVDTRNGTVTGRVALAGPKVVPVSALSPDGTRLYVANGRHLSVVDTATVTVVATAELPDQQLPAGWSQGDARGLVVGPDGATVYVTQYGSWNTPQYGPSRVLAYSTAQQRFTASVQLPDGGLTDPAAIGAPVLRPNGKDLYVGTRVGVVHLSTASGTPAVVGTVPGTEKALEYDLALTPDGTRLLAVGEDGHGQGDLIDPATDTVAKHVTLSGGADQRLARSNADGSRFYVSTYSETDGPAVLSFDSATGAAVPGETVTISEDQITGIAAGPDGHTLYLGATSYVSNGDGLTLDARLRIVSI
ncbi:hypothetical protein [Kitasatospora sp. NPDC093558]|uniref:hypothetical protein n=1 Tax=Kitasatospora sp. NPDC093558 TaxID=3155201 RepID=UPI003424752F